MEAITKLRIESAVLPIAVMEIKLGKNSMKELVVPAEVRARCHHFVKELVEEKELANFGQDACAIACARTLVDAGVEVPKELKGKVAAILKVFANANAINNIVQGRTGKRSVEQVIDEQIADEY